MSRKSNQDLAKEYRETLTKGAMLAFEGLTLADGTPLLVATKPWRDQLWRQFRELEDRLCPNPPR